MDSRFPAREEIVTTELLARQAAETPDRVYLVFDDGEEWTYGRTAAEARQGARRPRVLGCARRRAGLRTAERRLPGKPAAARLERHEFARADRPFRAAAEA